MDDPLTSTDERAASDGDLGRVARGGALNLVGAVTYGAANFALIVVVTTQLGARGAGQFLIAVAVFNIGVKVAELGAATGFIRMVSRTIALDRAAELPALVVVGLVPVALAGTAAAAVVWASAPELATLVGEDADSAVTTYLRTLAPFLPVVALYSVVVQGTRGFGTMRAQAFVEKIGKASAQPVVALVVLASGAGSRGLALAWVLPAVVAAVPAGLWWSWLARRAMATGGSASVRLVDVGRGFWGFAAPRALSQVFQVTVIWFDTLLIGALLGTREAGIYTAATRFLLVGTFVAEAIMQVVGPQISSLVSRGEHGRAQRIYQAATGWQVLLVWPAMVLIGAFAPVLLALFGQEFTDGAPALRVLVAAMLLASLFGPSDTVVLMSGRSSLSLLNTTVSVSLNVGGNLLLTPRYGLVGAAVAWALSIVVAGALPAAEAWRWLGLHPFGPTVPVTAVVAAATIGVPSAVALGVVGAEPAAFVAVCLVAGGLFAAASWAARERIGLDQLWRSLGRRSVGRPVSATSSRR